MGAFTRLRISVLVDFMPDLEKTELFEVLRILDDVAMDTRQQRCPQQFLSGGDRVEYANVIRRNETKP